MKTHKDLVIWRKGIELVEKIYAVSAAFPGSELYALTSQMRRAAISFPSNLAEGAARSSKKEFAHFVSISLGSLSELETQCIIASRLGYKIDPEILDYIERLRKQTLNFLKHLKSECQNA